ncbi:MAG: ATP-binding protein [Elusimicrobia bacterium]|nr:ATP-binding protein [Elusimicrobiota bacterium]
MKIKKRIVFTGGPSGGKTSVIEIAQRKYGKEIVTVPEAASVLYGGGFPRRPGPRAMKHIQRAIYFTVRELEDMSYELDDASIFLCDRGTLDSIAYWPENSKEDFLSSVGSSLEKEISRYDIVIHMRPPQNPDVYKLSGTRIEDHQAALDLDKKTEEAWRGHPKRFIIEDEPDFLLKAEKAIKIIDEEIRRR